MQERDAAAGAGSAPAGSKGGIEMGNNLADFIERFILGKLINSQEGHVLMRRNDLAIELSCAPSQISYVLNTRFTPDRGFVVESRRGAGGFVRIVSIVPEVKEESASSETVLQVVARLAEAKVISRREEALLCYMLEMSANFLGKKDQFTVLREALHRMAGKV